VTWRPLAASGNFEIGIALFEQHRGHGLGTEAQRFSEGCTSGRARGGTVPCTAGYATIP
jgi:hypothetical protein